MSLEWFKRWKRKDTKTAERRVLGSRCGAYKVEESNIKYGRKWKKNGDYLGIPIFYRAMARGAGGIWKIISCHKNANAAQKALEYLHDKGKPKPKPKPKRKKVKPDANSL